MTRIALAQPGMGADSYAAEDFIPQGATNTGMVATSSIIDTILQTGSQILTGITQPDVVKNAMNRFVFGVPTSPTAPYPAAVSSSQIIPGLPNSYLMIGAAALAFIVMKKR